MSNYTFNKRLDSGENYKIRIINITRLSINKKWQLFTIWKDRGSFGKRKTKIQPWYIFHTICAITGLSSNNIMHIIRVATYIPFEPKVSIILSWWCGAYFLFFLIMEPWWHLVTLTSFIIRFCLSDSQNSDKIDWLNIQFSDILWHASKSCFVEWKTALLVLNTYVNQWYILRLSI